MAASEAKHGSLEAQRRGVLSNPKAAIGMLAFCLYASVSRWWSAMRHIRVSYRDFYYLGHHFSYDPIYIFGLAFSILILVSIAFKSPLRADRFVFGAGAFAFGLSAVAQFAVLSAPELWAVRAAYVIAWTIAAAVCLSILAGWTKRDEKPISSD
jgi:hypothetical protein